ncbi:Spo0E family sporulation regulatory protein-aspartic acid phosphatase [Clostridium guangxiense]|uniref:Spo0E family sporulation regulatory protein-aspartic acid phosphatase n=1 Tax=Clostridium guangxiense TaxID=1662055 RepID=UPI001E500E81|nr:Spo0E family sporulation regulatory protein-aspartic acid phosphatase [Clostridium guangxiense]MCD2345119.1 Spo0E family sporulation regulatory protein-aspartic acid phosphatase [Clostridium guangxiense]
MERKNEEINEKKEELYKLIKKYGIKNYEVLLKSKEINDDINKEMRRKINMEFQLKVFSDKNIIWLQSKNYSIIYKDCKVYIGLIAKNDNTLWFGCINKIFSTTKEAFNYLIGELEHREENNLIL